MESLYRKYRPLTFESVVGQQHIVSTLEHAVTEGRISHAYLFCGPRGTGKTTMARILAKALLCTRADAARAEGASGCMPDGTCEECRLIAEGAHPDVYELDAASRTGVDNVREEIINSVSFTPVRGAYKVYIIDEVHMLTTPAFNALLKTLEEPPEHVVFILCTTDPQKILETILSRCQRFDFHRISNSDIVGRLRYICEQEGFEYDAEALEIVAKHARGGMRDALSTLEQLSVFGNGSVRVTDARSLLGEVSSTVLSQFGQAIAARDVAALFGLVRQQVDAGEDLMELTRDLVAHVRDIYMVRVAGARPELFDGADEDVEALAEEARQFETADRLARVLTVLDDAALEMRAAADTRLVLEIALTRLARPESDLTLEALAERLDRLEARVASGVPSAPLTAQGIAELTGRAADAPASGAPWQSGAAAAGSGAQPGGSRLAGTASFEGPQHGGAPERSASASAEVDDARGGAQRPASAHAEGMGGAVDRHASAQDTAHPAAQPRAAAASEEPAAIPGGMHAASGDRQAAPVAAAAMERGGFDGAAAAGAGTPASAAHPAAQERSVADGASDAGVAGAAAAADGTARPASPAASRERAADSVSHAETRAVAGARPAEAFAAGGRSAAPHAAGPGAPAGPAYDDGQGLSSSEHPRESQPASAAAPAPQRSAAAVAASSAAATPAVTDPGELQRKWAEVVQRAIKADPSRGSLLLSATAQADDGCTLTVNLPAGSGFAVAMLGRPDTQSTVLPLVSAVFGARSVRYTMGGQAAAPAAKAPAPAPAASGAQAPVAPAAMSSSAGSTAAPAPADAAAVAMRAAAPDRAAHSDAPASGAGSAVGAAPTDHGANGAAASMRHASAPWNAGSASAEASAVARGMAGGEGAASVSSTSAPSGDEASAAASGVASAPDVEPAHESAPSGAAPASGPASASASAAVPEPAPVSAPAWDDDQVPYDDASAMAYEDDFPPFDMPDAGPGASSAGFGTAPAASSVPAPAAPAPATAPASPVASGAATPSVPASSAATVATPVSPAPSAAPAASAPSTAPSAPSPSAPAPSASAAPSAPAVPNPFERMAPASSDAPAGGDVDVASVLGNVFGDGVKFFPME